MSPAIERESMEVDVLYVGAGPATLASALHLMNQVAEHNRRAEAAGRPGIEPPTRARAREERERRRPHALGRA